MHPEQLGQFVVFHFSPRKTPQSLFVNKTREKTKGYFLRQNFTKIILYGGSGKVKSDRDKNTNDDRIRINSRKLMREHFFVHARLSAVKA